MKTKKGEKVIQKPLGAPTKNATCSDELRSKPCVCSQEQKKETKTPMKKTVVRVKFDCGFPNSLFIRGEGISALSWSKGTQMTNLSKNEWIWECCRPCSRVECKVLINDQIYETGENHTLAYGDELTIVPKF